MTFPELFGRPFLAMLLVITLTSCATVGPDRMEVQAAEDLWQVRNTRLASLNWILSGRVAVKNERESWHAHLRWRQINGRYTINFQSPFGQLLARLMGDDSGVSLYLPDDRVLSSEDPSQLLHDQLGWAVPVTGLQRWVAGVPASGSIDGKDIDGKGRLTHLIQQGWTIDYPRYTTVQGIDMPKKILLKREGMSIRLMIDRWEFQSDDGDTPGTST